MSESDILIIGSGAAGLTAALNLADRLRVTVHSRITSPSTQAGQMMFMPITRISGLNLSVALT